MRVPLLCIIFFCGWCWSQELELKGRLVSVSGAPFDGLTLQVSGTTLMTQTNANGLFKISLPQAKKQGLLLVLLKGKTILKIPYNNLPLDLGQWVVMQQETEWPVFSAEDMGLFEDAMEDFDRQQIGSVLQARKNLFLNTAAYQFSSTFFRLRGLDNSNQSVYINGILMNEPASGTARWQQWGGINDFINASQKFTYGNAALDSGWGGFQSTTEIELRPSQLRAGLKISQASSNSNYQWRTMASYVRPPNSKGWGMGLLFSRRAAQQGYQEGTLYNAISGAFLAEKIWNNQHATWIATLYTPTHRGKSAPLTQEVFDIKGRKYNPYWGMQQNKIRNSRVTSVNTPLIFLNHRWEPNSKSLWQFNAGVSMGQQGQTRVFYGGHERLGNSLVGGGQNPDPVYYQRLPSYALRFLSTPDYEKAYWALNRLKTEGQFHWEALYNANVKKEAAIYALYKDMQKQRNVSLAIHHRKSVSPKVTFFADTYFSAKQDSFFATPTDLFGARFLWDYNPYAYTIEKAQNDLEHPDKKVVVGVPFMYHYSINTRQMGLSGKIKYSHNGFNLNWRLTGVQYSYQRTGHFKNGSFPLQSFGKGAMQTFKYLQSAFTLDYALSGRHHFSFHTTLALKPPPFRTVYINPREHHGIVPNQKESQGIHLDFGYRWQGTKLNAETHLYGIFRKNLTSVGFYFADGIGGDYALFVQEILTDMNHKHWGMELALTYQLLTDLKIMGVAAWGQFRYANNPQLFLSTTPTEEAKAAGFEDGWKAIGVSQLKNYRLAGGPQQAFSLGMEYEDPSYWRWAIHGNFFAKAFLAPNPLTRSANLYADTQGLPQPTFEAATAHALLQQEAFTSYFLLHSTFGKSWLIKKHYLGVFLSVQNILNQIYKTGGYEQGRNANYNALVEDRLRPAPLFGPKYWWGRGTTYFLQFSIRF